MLSGNICSGIFRSFRGSVFFKVPTSPTAGERCNDLVGFRRSRSGSNFPEHSFLDRFVVFLTYGVDLENREGLKKEYFLLKCFGSIFALPSFSMKPGLGYEDLQQSVPVFS